MTMLPDVIAWTLTIYLFSRCIIVQYNEHHWDYNEDSLDIRVKDSITLLHIL